MHSLLNRQLRKSGLSRDEGPEHESWNDFLERIDKAYREFDQDRYLLERSLRISSEEMQDTYAQLRKSESRYALAANAANDGLWEWDMISGEFYYSPRLFEIMGVDDPGDKVFTNEYWASKVHPKDQEMVMTSFISHLKGESERFECEHRAVEPSGNYKWVMTRGLAVRDENGRAIRIAGSVSDISERKTVEEKMAFDAVHDMLTGLPNRKKLMERLGRSLDRSKIDPTYLFAILFIDLDRFKTINDSLGHHCGDEYLVEISKRLNFSVRPSDMVARLGGDEFVILADNVTDQHQVVNIADRMIGVLQQPVKLSQENVTASTSASIGIVMAAEHYEKPEDMVRDADLAMYCAKIKGKARYEVFEPQMHKGAVSLFQTEMDLRIAIEKNEFSLFYQPIISLESERVAGFEALLRWRHPLRGMVSPADFIPVAEETGLIVPIGKWVLEEACMQMKKWQELFPGAEDLSISVNLSTRQLETWDFVEKVAEILDETGLNPSNLKLEITESVIMNNADQTIERILELRDMGIMVSIDDFGTGYSSLSYLHKFPIGMLKADRSFISSIGASDESAEIIKTIVLLAKNLGIEVIAEGIETSEQLEFLCTIGCGYGQGFYYSRPMNGPETTEMIANLSAANPNFVIPPAPRATPAIVAFR